MKTHPFLAGLTAPLLIAHRGGAALAPENTLPAFEQALTRYRADWLELDVHATRDGVLVVAHDDTVERCTDGAGRIDGLTFAELSQLDFGHRFTADGGLTFPFRGQGVRAPRLEDVLAAFPGVPLNIELKADAALAPLLELTRRQPALVDRCCLGSTDDALAARLAEALPAACCFLPEQALMAFVIAVRSGEIPPQDERFHVLDMPWEWEGMQVCDAAVVKAARDAGHWVNVWTVDDEPTMREALKIGVGGVMTDRPDRLRAVLDGR